MSHPSSWSRYHALRKQGLIPENAFLNVFGTRFRLARNLEVCEVVGMTDRTADAYTACLKVGLAYAAVEALENARVFSGKVEFKDARLAAALRDSKNRFILERIVENDVVREANKNRLRDFLAGKSEDLREPIYSIRNLMFHGSLTANFLKLDTSKTRRNIIYMLAETTLVTADEKFSEIGRAHV